MAPIWTAPNHAPGTTSATSVYSSTATSDWSRETSPLNSTVSARVGGSGGVLDGHMVESTDPVTITPSIVCPAGCHYFIKGGVVT